MLCPPRLYPTADAMPPRAKMIIGLAFIHIENIHEAIEHLTDALPDELQPLLDRFEDNYGGRRLRRGNGRPPPLFQLECGIYLKEH
ncbi:hypothetical protein chiPu_0020195 [Chiloscyllium punctatum]|uniref:Uncharacterized protein n=1 Tax=Chiloscyllium punctatum TaxID=137246 RepID=A0A401RU95_CHIPU|nr:hypothetical protein [Chiloscyllium punctatum]